MALEQQDCSEASLLRRPMLLGLLAASLYAVVTLPLLAGATPHALSAAGLHAGILPISLGLAGTLIVLSTIDALTFELPDVLTLPLAATGVLLHLPLGLSFALDQLVAAILAFACLAGLAWFYRATRGRAGLGVGDAKLLAAGGAWLGVSALPSVLLLATGTALASVLLARAWRTPISLSDRMPFGPYLAFAIWLVWLYGPIATPG